MSHIDTAVIGQYRILEHLGQGGMATVYKAYHPRLDRLVAIKMIHRHFLDDTNFVARFEREAQIVARLEHPNIVPVYDFAEYAGQPYIVMKFIEGSTLKAALDEGPIPIQDAMHVMTHVASALDYAHGKGVLHRDIKPSNIMLDLAATPYLADFGLARIATGGATTLSADMLIGTPYYMSPEQGRGDEDIDHRADIYSLGIVLYELLTGSVPYRSGTPYSIINQHITEPLRPPRELNPNIPPPVEAVILRATAKDRAERYKSAGALLAALNQALAPAAMPALPDAQPLAESVLVAHKTRRIHPLTPPATAPAAAISAPVVADAGQPTVVDAKLPAATAPAPKAKRSLIGNILMIIGALVVVLLALFIINRVVRNNRADTVTPTLATLPTQPASGFEMYTTADGLRLFVVTVLSVADAQALVRSEPENPAAYLSLVRALAVEERYAETEQPLTNGATRTNDAVTYMLSAAAALHDANRDGAALLLLRDSISRLQDAPNFDLMREFGGRSLYEAALTQRGVELFELANLRDLRDLSDATLRTTSPIAQAISARALLTVNRPLLAARLVETALNRAPGLAEAQLVLGEVQAANGNIDSARLQWTAARDGASAPNWVKERARLLLGETASAVSLPPTATDIPPTATPRPTNPPQPTNLPPPTRPPAQPPPPTPRSGDTPLFPPPQGAAPQGNRPPGP